MKKLILNIGIVFVLCIAQTALAQEELFKVLASKGTNKLVASGSTEEKPLFIGKKLMKGDKIVLSEGCYLGLAHKTGKTIEIKKSGTYEVSKLAGEVVAQNASLGKKYLDYVVTEVTAKDEDMAKNRHKFMEVTGSVERGAESVNLVAPPKELKSFVVAAPVTLRWNRLADVTTYVVKVTNLFDDVLYTAETNDTSATVDLSTVNKSNSNEVHIVSVYSKANKNTKSVDYPLNYIGGERGMKLKKDLTDLKKEFSEPSALNQLVLASFYEENKMYLDAMEAYAEAIKFQPDVEDYKVLYGQFLVRTGIAKK